MKNNDLNQSKKSSNKIDAKRDYLVKTLSRTKRKDYENYVINAIYHKLNNLNIKPVSQQYVKRTDNSYALLDLYFPQLNIAIECDEKYHKNKENQMADINREIDVYDKLTAISENKLDIIRIDVVESIDNINLQIDKAVSKILNKYNMIGSPKWIIEDSCTVVAKQGYIRVSDNLEFYRIADIAKAFNRKCGVRSCTFNVIKGKSFVWCPKLAVKDDYGKFVQSSKNWNNLISEDRTEIIEEYTDSKISTKNRYEKMFSKLTPKQREEKFNKIRYVFAYHKNALGQKFYKFLGIFKFNRFENNSAIFIKIGDVVYVNNLK